MIEYEINAMKKKVISKGEKITSKIINKIFSIKAPDSQLIYIMKIFYEILRINIDMFENNSTKITNNNINTSINTINNKNENINWELIKKTITNKLILLLISFISETSNLYLSKYIIDNSAQIKANYNHYKICYINSCPEIIVIVDFINILIDYYKKLNLVKKLYISNKNKKNKMETIQTYLDKNEELIQKTKLLLSEITKDYKDYNSLKNSKYEDTKIIYGYNILEKYSLYEKYIVVQENINDYNDDEYYNNYGGNDYNNSLTKIKYVIKLKKKYRNNKDKFILQLSSSLLSYSKGIRKINKEKFIQNVKENRNNSLNKNSQSNSLNKMSTNKSINNNNNNLLMRSIESNNSSINFQTNSILNVTRNNSTPYRSENSRNNTFIKKSFVEFYPTFDNFYQLSNRNLLLKEGLKMSINELDQSKQITRQNQSFSLKNGINKKKETNNNTIKFRNLKQQQINLKFENEQWSPCSFCCKTLQKKINKIYNK